MRRRAIAFGLIAMAALLGCEDHTERDRLRVVVGSLLKDPASAQYRNDHLARHADGRIYYCGEINARNAFGGYVGFRQFIASAEAATISSPDDTERGRAAFANFWKLNCAGE